MIRAQKEKLSIDCIQLCDTPLLFFSALLLKGEVKVPIYSSTGLYMHLKKYDRLPISVT
jgi:hypothetical protein